MSGERISFTNDYSAGGHERVLAALCRTNLLRTEGYGTDPYCKRAADLIRGLAQTDAPVHFIPGGTQANLTIAAAALRPHQGVIAADTGHVSVHEAGAIEAGGHKVLTLPGTDGKLSADAVERLLAAHYADPTAEHTVQPGLVYLSQTSELGTVYTLAELTALRAVCDSYGLYLYLDGARLGCALTAPGADAGLPELARLCDAFYIGGAKQGALFGEALIIRHPALARDFRSIMKQRGGMLAKGRLLGVQFAALFEDGLYFELAEAANAHAARIAAALRDAGCAFLAPPQTNQLFPIMEKERIKRLSERFAFSWWQHIDAQHDAVRICTAWYTEPAEVDALLEALRT